MAETPRLLGIVGPTASGKSALALELAQEHDAEIVSCDSLQVYRGLDIGSAKPTAAEQASIPHHLIDVVDPGDEFSVAEYARLGRAAVGAVAERGRVPLVVGGTGLYLRGLLEGLFAGPARVASLRARLEGMARRFGDERLHRLMRAIDPAAAARVPPRDRVRTVRALEVFLLTGRRLSEHHAEHRQRPAGRLRGFRTLVIGLAPAREALRARVVARTRAMLDGGLLDEARDLVARGLGQERPLRAIGYRQAVAAIEGRLARAELEGEIVRATMRYAKRQMTWFRHQAQVLWFPSAEGAHLVADRWLRGEETGGVAEFDRGARPE